MNTITQSDLNQIVKVLNNTVGAPAAAWINGIAQINHHFIDYAYGGQCLMKIANTGGGCNPVLPGFVSKRELYTKINAYIDGYRAGQENGYRKAKEEYK